MITLKSRFIAAVLGVALIAGHNGVGDTLSGDEQATTQTDSAATGAQAQSSQTESTDTQGAGTQGSQGKGSQATDVARLDLAFKENPNDAKVRLAIKLAEQDPSAALRHIELVNGEGGLAPHHMEALTIAAADAADALEWEKYRLSVERDMQFNQTSRDFALGPVAMTPVAPEPVATPAPAPGFKPRTLAPVPEAPSPFGIRG